MSEEKETIEVGSNALSNIKHELFVQYFVCNSETRNNSTLSYAMAYEYRLEDLPKDDAVWAEVAVEGGREGETENKCVQPSTYDKAYQVCATEGARVLKYPETQKRVVQVLNEYVTDDVVDAELGKVILQDREKTPKVQAIKVYNDIQGRIIKKTDITTMGDKIEGVVVLPAKE